MAESMVTNALYYSASVGAVLHVQKLDFDVNKGNIDKNLRP